MKITNLEPGKVLDVSNMASNGTKTAVIDESKTGLNPNSPSKKIGVEGFAIVSSKPANYLRAIKMYSEELTASGKAALPVDDWKVAYDDAKKAKEAQKKAPKKKSVRSRAGKRPAPPAPAPRPVAAARATATAAARAPVAARARSGGRAILPPGRRAGQ